MSDEAVKRRLRRAIRAAIEEFHRDNFGAEKPDHPFFHIKVYFVGRIRWIHISLDSISAQERQRVRTEKIEGSKEVWVHRKGAERFDKYFF